MIAENHVCDVFVTEQTPHCFSFVFHRQHVLRSDIGFWREGHRESKLATVSKPSVIVGKGQVHYHEQRPAL